MVMEMVNIIFLFFPVNMMNMMAFGGLTYWFIM